jgi:hypothetical protein
VSKINSTKEEKISAPKWRNDQLHFLAVCRVCSFLYTQDSTFIWWSNQLRVRPLKHPGLFKFVNELTESSEIFDWFDSLFSELFFFTQRNLSTPESATTPLLPPPRPYLFDRLISNWFVNSLTAPI